MLTIFFQPLALPPGEYTYTCADGPHLVKVYRAMEKLQAEIIDVERDGESLTSQELAELLAE